MSGMIDDGGDSEFDVQGFVSRGGHALGECLDAAGIDWRLHLMESEAQHACSS